MKIVSSFSFMILISLVIFSCKQESPDWSYSSDDTMADFTFSDIYNIMSTQDDSAGTLRSCAVLTLSSTTFPITVTADFNNSTGCGDGRVRSGTLTAVYSGRWNDPGTVVTITSTDYTVNGYRLEGTNVITNTSGVTGNPSFTSEIVDGQITTPNGDLILRESVRNYEWIEGATTPLDFTDDVWQLTGNATGTTTSGNQYTATITTPVVKANSCKWIQQGVIEITPNIANATARVIDYGANICDNIVNVSYGQWYADIYLN